MAFKSKVSSSEIEGQCGWSGTFTEGIDGGVLSVESLAMVLFELMMFTFIEVFSCVIITKLHIDLLYISLLEN